MEEKINRILFLLEDENVGICGRVKSLEVTVNGNGKVIGMSEEVRVLKKANTKNSAFISSGVTLTVFSALEYIKHRLGW